MTEGSSVIDQSTVSVLPALELSRAWRAVSTASGHDHDRPALDHTVCLEQYTQGVRLIATDTYRLLTAWVPAQTYLASEEPDLGELPHATAVAWDQWGRAKALFAYLGRQASKEDGERLMCLVRLGVPWQNPDTPEPDLQFDGFEALAVDIEYPDHERLQLPVYEGAYPLWRNAVHDAAATKTGTLALSQESLAVLARAAKVYGNDSVVAMRLGGEGRPVAVELGADPSVRGLVMPCRWNFAEDAPEPADEPYEPAAPLSETRHPASHRRLRVVR